mmetsp:Transcript_96319/g.276550  ORF Transcript_96319/g.276550 Transcript_96319/m.276550 type:complete len:201 (+) Transcript_96319:499-1101(+)
MAQTSAKRPMEVTRSPPHSKDKIMTQGLLRGSESTVALVDTSRAPPAIKKPAALAKPFESCAVPVFARSSDCQYVVTITCPVCITTDHDVHSTTALNLRLLATSDHICRADGLSTEVRVDGEWLWRLASLQTSEMATVSAASWEQRPMLHIQAYGNEKPRRSTLPTTPAKKFESSSVALAQCTWTWYVEPVLALSSNSSA